MWDYQFRFWISELLFSSINLYGRRGASLAETPIEGFTSHQKLVILLLAMTQFTGDPRFYRDVAAGRYADEIDEPVDDTIRCGCVGLCI
jgi:hypothetical protein